MNAFRLIIGQIAALFLMIFNTSASAQISAVYAFGDGVCTTTDNNSNTPSLYFGKRFCNGPVFIEELTTWLGVPYFPGRNKSYFGHDSAELKNNIDAFDAPSNVATSLFVVWVANADFVEFSQVNAPPYTNADRPAWDNFIEDSVNRHKQSVHKLYTKGVRILVMPNAVDISATPGYQLSNTDSNFIRNRAIQFNTLFRSEMIAYAATKPGLRLYLPDTFDFFEDVLDNPSAYGLINPQVGGHSIDAINHLGNPSLNGPGANYVFWDYVHPTAKFQKKLSNFIEELIGTAPAIVANPIPATIPSGTSTNLNVSFSGTTPSIQWYRGGRGDTSNPVIGATSTWFTTPPLTETTHFWARASNVLGTSDSNAAAITVQVSPSIITQPASATIASGSTITFNIAAAGTSPAFQWYAGNSGVTSNPIPGANSSTFTTPPLTTTSTFWVRASNLVGTADSSAATVVPVPPMTLWQNSQFTAQDLANPIISGPAADPDGDGLTNEQEYLFGLLPKASSPSPSPAVTISGNQISLSFTALLASGPGYDGLTRRYTLECSNALNSAVWAPIPGYIDVVGNNQTVTYTASASGPRNFYRLGVRVTP